MKLPKTTKKSADKAAVEDESDQLDFEEDNAIEDTGCPRYTVALATDPIVKCWKMDSSCCAVIR